MNETKEQRQNGTQTGGTGSAADRPPRRFAKKFLVRYGFTTLLSPTYVSSNSLVLYSLQRMFRRIIYSLDIQTYL